MDLLIAIVAAATAIAVPGRGAATPSIAVRGSLAIVVFSGAAEGGQTDVFAAVSRDRGSRFGGPVRINGVAGSSSGRPRAPTVGRPKALRYRDTCQRTTRHARMTEVMLNAVPPSMNAMTSTSHSGRRS